MKLTSHGILHYLKPGDLSKCFTQLILPIFIFSWYFFQRILPDGKFWSYPTLLISWFINFNIGKTIALIKTIAYFKVHQEKSNHHNNNFKNIHICSICTRTDSTFQTIVSVSIEIMFFISVKIVLHKSPRPKILSVSLCVLFMAPPNGLIISGTLFVMHSTHL